MEIDHGDHVKEMPIPNCAVGMRILLVEPDILALATTISLLQESTYQVTTVEQPEVALTMLRDQEAKYDLIIIAANLKSMSCLELLRNVKSLSDVPVAVVCSKEELKEGEIAKQQGATIFLEKPFSRDDARSLWQYVFTRSNKRGSGHVRGDFKTPCLNMGTSSHASRDQIMSQSQNVNVAASNHDIGDHSIANIVKEDKVESTVGIVDKGKGKEVTVDVHKRKRRMEFVGDEGSSRTAIERGYKINDNENDSKMDGGKMDINSTSDIRLQCDPTSHKKFMRVLTENQRYQGTPSRLVSSPRAQVSNILTHPPNFQQSSYINPHRGIMNPTATFAGHNPYDPQRRLQTGYYLTKRDSSNTKNLGTISALQPRNVFRHKLPIAGLYGTRNVYNRERDLSLRLRSNRGIMNNSLTGNQFNQTVPARSVCSMNRDNVSTNGSIIGSITSQTVPFGCQCQMTRNTIGTNGSTISNMTKLIVPVRSQYEVNSNTIGTNGSIVGNRGCQVVSSDTSEPMSQSSAVLSTNMKNGVESLEQIPSLQGRIDEIRRGYRSKKLSERTTCAASKQQSGVGANSASTKAVNQLADTRGISTDHNHIPSETLGNPRGIGTKILPPEQKIPNQQENTAASCSQPLGGNGLSMEEIIAELNSDTEENDLQSLGFDITDILR